MEKTLKQPIVAVNRTGAGGALGIRAHGPVVDLDLPGGRPGQRQAALVRDEGLRAEFKNAMEKVSTPVSYLDAAVEKIGKVEEAKK